MRVLPFAMTVLVFCFMCLGVSPARALENSSELSAEEESEVMSVLNEALNPDRTSFTETEARKFVGKYGDRCIATLQGVITDATKPIEVRTRAAFVIGHTKDARVVPFLVKVIEQNMKEELDYDEYLFMTVCLWGLGYTGQPEALTYLEQVADEATPAPWEARGLHPRHQGFRSIGKFQGPEGTALDFRVSALRGLAQAATPEALSILERLLSASSSEYMRGYVEENIRIAEELMEKAESSQHVPVEE